MPTNINVTSSVPDPWSYKNKKEFSTELDSGDFMHLLIEQLKNQDPMSPMDNQQFVQQTSMMTMVQKISRMTQLMEESNASLRNINEYESLIGRKATYDKVQQDELTGETTHQDVTALISAVKMQDKKLYVKIGDDYVTVDKIKNVDSKGFSNDNLYAQMIGYRADYTEDQVNEYNLPNGTKTQTVTTVAKSGVITSFAMKDGSVEFTLDNGKKLTLDKISGFETEPGNIAMDQTLKYASMVGNKVTYLDKQVNKDGTTSNVETTGVVQALSMKNGLVEFLLDNGKKIKPIDIVGLEVSTPASASQNDSEES